MPVGIVNYFLPERRFGFLKYSSTPDSSRLDSESYFKDSALQSLVQAGDRVQFELASVEDGRSEAINVERVDDRLTGIVCTVGRKSYCYIRVDGRFEDSPEVFCAFDDVLPNLSTGNRALTIGSNVSFRIELQKIKGETFGKERAVEVINEDSEPMPIDPTFREFGQVTFWNGDRGHIIRSNCDTLSFLAKNVVSEGVDEIKVGCWLEYGIQVNRHLWSDDKQTFYHRVFAKEIAVCLGSEESSADSPPILPVEFVAPESFEAKFLNAEELPLDAPEPERLEPGHVYLPSERRMSLKKLIARKRAAFAGL